MKHPGEQRRGAGSAAAKAPATARTHLGGDAPPAAESLVGRVHGAAGLCCPAVSHTAQLGAAGRVQHGEDGGGGEPAAAHEAVRAQQRCGQAAWARGVGAERGPSRRPAARPREETAAGTHQRVAQGAAAPQPRAGRHGPSGDRKVASKRAAAEGARGGDALGRGDAEQSLLPPTAQPLKAQLVRVQRRSGPWEGVRVKVGVHLWTVTFPHECSV